MTRTRERGLWAAGALVFLVLFLGGLALQRSESSDRTVDIVVGETDAPDRVDVEASIATVDHRKRDLEIRLVFRPRGSFVQEDGFLLARDLTLFVNSETGGQERKFEKGKPMSTQDVVIKMYGGEFTDYPLDSFVADLEVLLTSVGEGGRLQPEPLGLSLAANVPGLRISVGEETGHAPGQVAIELGISRSLLTHIVAWGVIALYWLMTLAVLAVTWAIVVRGHELAADILAYIAGLLFAFVAFRTTMPGDPPIGSLSDFLAFFWCEALVALSLVALVVTYVRGPERAPTV